VTCVAFSPDGLKLASGSRDHTVRVWDLALKQQPRVLEGQAGPVQGVDFSPDGRFVASASAAGAVRVWDLEGGQGTRTLQGHPGLVRTVAFSPDGQKLASVAFDTRTADPTPVFAGHGGVVQAVAFGPAGNSRPRAAPGSTRRAPSVARSSCGTRRPARPSGYFASTPARSAASPSATTASGSPRAARTGKYGSLRPATARNRCC
jgi:hypothetical protein